MKFIKLYIGKIKKSKFVVNSIVSLVCKIVSAGISIISVPLLLNFLGLDNYGIWVTLASIAGWLQFTDFGIANGLKNKITECNAKKDCYGINNYFIGTIQLYTIICLLLILFLPIIIKYLKMPAVSGEIIFGLYIPLLVFLPLSLGNAVLAGLRKVGLSSIILTVTQLIWFISIIILNYTAPNSSLLLVVVSWLISSFLGALSAFYFSVRLSNLSIVNFFNSNHLKSATVLLSSSGKFFLLQIFALLIYSIGNYLTYIYLGPKEVAKYDTVNKVFIFLSSLFNILIAVAWPEFTNYFILGKYKKAIDLLRYIIIGALVFTCFGLVLSEYSPYIIDVWTAGKIKVTFLEVIPFMLLFTIQMFSYIGAVILNAAEKINGQLFFAMFSAIAIIPIAIAFFERGLSIAAVPLASMVVIIPTTVYCLYSSWMLLEKGVKNEEDRSPK